MIRHVLRPIPNNGGMSWPKDRPTRKDWRHNDCLSGTNAGYWKRYCRRLFRKRSKSEDCGPYHRETGHRRYDINDYK